MKLFGEHHLSNFLSQKLENAKREIQFLNEVELKKTSKEDVLNNLLRQTKVPKLEVNLSKRTSKVGMRDVPAQRFPKTYDVRPGVSYPCALVTYIYPIPSNSQLMLHAPAGYVQKVSADVTLAHNEMRIEYQTLYGNEILSDEVKNKVKDWIISVHEEIENTVAEINNQIEKFNNGISLELSALLDAKFKNFEDRKKQNDDLNDF
ncbi:hypothetical protein ACFSJW_14275 [Flavobacterium artemisiae]|uniref:Uncharacterized protein n=1 Tax=Flavobacterium artemisiae TaxID=2126556 RepID=A0ABW4HHD0_9FLAO